MQEAVLAQILCKGALCTKLALKGLLRADISAKDPFCTDFVCLFDRFHLPFGEGLAIGQVVEQGRHLSASIRTSAGSARNDLSATKYPGVRKFSASSPRTF